MLLAERVKEHFSHSIQTVIASADLLSDPIAKAAELIVQSLLNGGKILVCGNDGAAAHAQHLAAKLLNRYEMERPSLPAIALTTDTSTMTAISSDYQFIDIFSKQIYALAKDPDILIVLNANGNYQNILEAVKVAHEKEMKVVAISGQSSKNLFNALKESDIGIAIPSNKTAHIHECQTLVIHCLCDLIDQSLFGSDSF